MTVVVSGSIYSLPHGFNVKWILTEQKLVYKLMKELDLRFETLRVTGWSFSHTDQPFVGIEFEEEKLTTAVIWRNVIDEIVFGAGDFHGNLNRPSCGLRLLTFS